MLFIQGIVVVDEHVSSHYLQPQIWGCLSVSNIVYKGPVGGDDLQDPFYEKCSPKTKELPRYLPDREWRDRSSVVLWDHMGLRHVAWLGAMSERLKHPLPFLRPSIIISVGSGREWLRRQREAKGMLPMSRWSVVNNRLNN